MSPVAELLLEAISDVPLEPAARFGSIYLVLLPVVLRHLTLSFRGDRSQLILSAGGLEEQFLDPWVRIPLPITTFGKARA